MVWKEEIEKWEDVSVVYKGRVHVYANFSNNCRKGKLSITMKVITNNVNGDLQVVTVTSTTTTTTITTARATTLVASTTPTISSKT